MTNLKKLIDWKQSRYRKPLILKGARQVGKTYILKQFGEENYEGVAYFILTMTKTYIIYLKTQKTQKEY